MNGLGFQELSKRTPLFHALAVGMILLIIALPSHAVARCFGVPGEGPQPSETASWHLSMDVTSSNGFTDSTVLGVDEGASDGYDAAFDAVEPLFNLQPRSPDIELTLYAYFYYPDNPRTAAGEAPNPEATAGLSTSIVGPSENMTWPLQVAYLYPVDAVLEMRWAPDEARELSGYVVELFTPFGDILPMAETSNYSFQTGRGIHDFTIRALGQSESQGIDPLIGGTVTAYAIVVAIIIGLRRWRRGKKQA